MSTHDHSRSDPRIARVLGPAGPELTCEECFAFLDRYVELELGGHDPEAVIPGMASHLQGCPACEDDHAGLLDLLQRNRG